MKDFERISVKAGLPVKVMHNPTPYPMIGRGAHGAVFKLSKNGCVKIFPNESGARKEGRALAYGQGSPVFPRLYQRRRNYVVMEYISGSSLYGHLKKAGVVSETVTRQILFVLKELKRLKFSRQDAALRHLVWTKAGKLKVIDHANSLSRKYTRPVRLLKGLHKLGLKISFLRQVKKQDPRFYRLWRTK